ncbi:MAG: hypothetical protein WDZ85_00895 [Candidatus Paceibacterota bacterium]
MNSRSLFVVSLLGIIGLLAFSFTYFDKPVAAQSGDPVEATGYAWSSNIGWIKFDHGPIDPVVIDSNGHFQGYAWSPNIGWIDFNPAGPYPEGPPDDHGVQVDSDTFRGPVTGWARAIAGEDFADGWDGWIKMTDLEIVDVTNSSGDIIGGQLEGFAWGSVVTGWIAFDNLFTAGGCTGVCIDQPVQTQIYNLKVNVYDYDEDGAEDYITVTYDDGTDYTVTDSQPFEADIPGGTIISIQVSKDPNLWSSDFSGCDLGDRNCNFAINEHGSISVTFGDPPDPELEFEVEIISMDRFGRILVICSPNPSFNCSSPSLSRLIFRVRNNSEDPITISLSVLDEIIDFTPSVIGGNEFLDVSIINIDREATHATGKEGVFTITNGTQTEEVIIRYIDTAPTETKNL